MPKVIMDIKFYSVREIADLLGVTNYSVNKYITNGQLLAKTMGGRKYITEENLRDFLLQTDKPKQSEPGTQEAAPN